MLYLYVYLNMCVCVCCTTRDRMQCLTHVLAPCHIYSPTNAMALTNHRKILLSILSFYFLVRERKLYYPSNSLSMHGNDFYCLSYLTQVICLYPTHPLSPMGCASCLNLLGDCHSELAGMSYTHEAHRREARKGKRSYTHH